MSDSKEHRTGHPLSYADQPKGHRSGRPVTGSKAVEVVAPIEVAEPAPAPVEVVAEVVATPAHVEEAPAAEVSTAAEPQDD